MWKLSSSDSLVFASLAMHQKCTAGMFGALTGVRTPARPCVTDFVQIADQGALQHDCRIGWQRLGRPQLTAMTSAMHRCHAYALLSGNINISAGAGKSSVVSALLRLTEIESGQILIDSVDIRNVRLARLRSAVAVVPQSAFLFEVYHCSVLLECINSPCV